MKVKELINKLKAFNQEADVLVSSDEELNTLFQGIEMSYYGEEDSQDKVVLWGNSGTELGE